MGSSRRREYVDPASRAVLMDAPTEIRTKALTAAQRFEPVNLRYLKAVAGNRRFVIKASRNSYRFDSGSNSVQRMPRGDAEELMRKYGSGYFEIVTEKVSV